MEKLSFIKQVISEVKNDVPPGEMNTFTAAGDINNDGLIDFVVCGRNGKMVWLQNEGLIKEWEQHFIDNVDAMECGGSIVDVTGDGYPDIINGGDYRSDSIFWWHNPGKDGGGWTKRLIYSTGGPQIHDTAIGDITGHGKALIFTNQLGSKNGTNIYYIPLPKDPFISPWPDVQIIAEGMSEPNPYNNIHRTDHIQPEEGLAVGDIDGDGINELVCGTHWYKYTESGWERHKFTSGYITTKCAIGDIDGDGKNEIVLSEGDPLVYGKNQGGKVSWFKAKDNILGLWEEHVLDDFLYDPHSLQVGDICGNGRLDIFVGEVGKNDSNRCYIGRQPRLIIFENNGDGSFTRHIIDEGTGIHEAVLADLRNKGVLDIIGKPLHGAERWNVHAYYNNSQTMVNK